MSGVLLYFNKNYPIHARKNRVLRSDYQVFDRKSDAIVVIGLIPGSGPQSNEGFGMVPAVGVLFRATDFA